MKQPRRGGRASLRPADNCLAYPASYAHQLRESGALSVITYLLEVAIVVLIVLLIVGVPRVLASEGPGLQAFAEPAAGARPIVSDINSARTSINLEIYELQDPSVEAALAAAAHRHVNVRVILNRKDPFETVRPNTQAYGYLAAHHVQVRWSTTALSLTHEKMLEVDARTGLIMSLNLAGGYSSTRDYGIIDTQPADIAAMTETFDADWDGRKITPSTGTGDLVWSPGAGNIFVKAIDSATKAIDVENEEMDYRTATDALCSAAKRGVDVKIVMTYASEWASALSRLATCGAHVHLDHGQTYYIHAKALIIDGTSAIVGSTNLSAESLWYNRELSIRVTTPNVVAELASWFADDYAAAKSYGVQR